MNEKSSLKEQLQVVLIHGQGRTPLSMLLLDWHLRQQGYKAQYFGYAGFAETFEGITKRYVAMIERKIGSQPYAIVAHSLGGVITRAALPRLNFNPPQHLVMLAPPNHPALIAKKLSSNLIYRLATGDCGQKLGDDTFYQALPLPTVPTTIIAGTKGWHGRFSLFGDEVNDTLVSLQESTLEGYDRVLVPAQHSLIMYSRQVAEIIGGILGGVDSIVNNEQ